MSMPSFPPIDPNLTLEKAINMILSSISEEENSLGDIIKAEGEKINYAIEEVIKNGDEQSLQKLIEVNDSVNKLLDKINDTMIILKSKMNTALEYAEKPVPIPHPPFPRPPYPWPYPPIMPCPCPPMPCPVPPPTPCPVPPPPPPTPCLPDNIICDVIKCKCDTIIIECENSCGCDKKCGCDIGCECDKKCDCDIGCGCDKKPCPPPTPVPPIMTEEFYVIPDMQWRNGEALRFVNQDNGCGNDCNCCGGCGNSCGGCGNSCGGYGNSNAIDLIPGMYTIEFEFEINRGINTPDFIDIELFLGCENRSENYVNYSQEIGRNCSTFSGGLIFETPCDCSE
ncbi:MAG: hypothetical protein LBL93_05110, partial [Ruminococcus sp.]|nr:hypothetical protein [Ruminococcus sp.]